MSNGLTILVLGNGARESALGWAAEKSPLVGRVLYAPGNGGMDPERCYSAKDSDIPGLVDLAIRECVDLVIVGPEAWLVAGVVDQLTVAGIPAFGPSARCSRLESSKIFTKTLCRREGIPTADWQWTDSFDAAEHMIRAHSGLPVIKADGLCAGKGVVVPDTIEEAIQAAHDMLVSRIHGEAGAKIIIEERLTGPEVSLMSFCDGENAVVLPAARDFKRAFNGDKGPNTGGMGSYSPLPDVSDAMIETVRQQIILSTLRGMRSMGTPYQGLLYAGLMITKDGPRLIEHNVRFGDPETQVIIPRIRSDIIEWMLACTRFGGLANMRPLDITSRAAVCTVLASEGYPTAPVSGKPIGMHCLSPGDLLFHAGTKLDGDMLFSSGGRVMSCVGMGETIAEARKRSLDIVNSVYFSNMMFRSDIAAGV